AGRWAERARATLAARTAISGAGISPATAAPVQAARCRFRRAVPAALHRLLGADHLRQIDACPCDEHIVEPHGVNSPYFQGGRPPGIFGERGRNFMLSVCREVFEPHSSDRDLN